MMTNTGRRLTQGQFSFLPDLTDEQIGRQLEYALGSNWSIGIEYTDDPHPRNTYWEMFGIPMFDLRDAAGVLMEINDCRKTYPNHYIRRQRLRRHARRRVADHELHGQPPGATSRASAWRAKRSGTPGSLHASRPTPPTAPRASATCAECTMQHATAAAPSIDLQRDSFAHANVQRGARPARRRADRPGASQAAVREIAAFLAVTTRSQAARARRRAAEPAHELHRQSGHRQDHGGAAHGRDPASARLCAQRPCGQRHARRPGRPVHRPHRAQDQGSAEEGDGRRAVHRRGVLPLPARERARLRPGGDRDPAAGDGEPPRRPGRDPRRLQGPHADLLSLQPRHDARASRTTSTFPTTRRPSCWRSPSA